MKKITLFFLLISLGYCSQNGPSVGPDTLATVNQRSITKNEFLYQAQSMSSIPGSDVITKDGRIAVLKEMMNEELVFQQALKENFHLQNLDIKHEVVREYLKNKFAKDLPAISDQQVTEFYKKNQHTIDRVRASHILIAPKDKPDTNSKKEAKLTAEKIRNEILSGKITFEDAVSKYSTDEGTKAKNGDLGFFVKAQMVVEFSAAAFDLKKIGDISPVVESQYGYHIIKLTGEERNFDTYKERIRWKIYQDAMQPKIDGYFKSLKEDAKLKIINNDLMSINIPQQ